LQTGVIPNDGLTEENNNIKKKKLKMKMTVHGSGT